MLITFLSLLRFTFKFRTTCLGEDILGSADAFNHNFN